jgi:hypothetical protein
MEKYAKNALVFFVAAASWVLCGSCAGQVKTIKKIDYVVD